MVISPLRCSLAHPRVHPSPDPVHARSKHSNRESARRSYHRRRKRNRELEQENERLREGLELAHFYMSLIPPIPAQNEEVARRDATPAPAVVGVALPSMAAVLIGAE
jgi:hypothetical protein